MLAVHVWEHYRDEEELTAKVKGLAMDDVRVECENETDMENGLEISKDVNVGVEMKRRAMNLNDRFGWNNTGSNVLTSALTTVQVGPMLLVVTI